MQTEREPAVPRGDDLRRVVADITGVAAVEVDLRDEGPPHIRVWLDGTATSAVVGDEIQRVLAGWPATAGALHVPRRTGLGRGLGELLETNGAASAPAQLAADGAEVPITLALVAVEETAGGVSVRAADSTGGIAFSPVEDPRSLNQAVVAAVARLRHHRPVPRLSGVEVRDVSAEPVLTAVLELADGSKAAGAAIVAGGMPFTLGKAVWEALASTE